MFDDDPLDDWIEFETFRILSDDYEQCPACNIGILIPVESETHTEFVCDICDATFRVKEQ